MISFLVVAVAVGVVAADVSSLGYHYNVPQTSYQTPAYQDGSVNYNTGFTQNTGSTGSGFNFQGQSSGTRYQGLNAGQTNTAYQGAQEYQYQGSGSSGSGYVSAPSVIQSGYQGLSSGQTGYQGASTSTGFVSGASGSGQYYPSVSSSGVSDGQGSFQFQNQYQNQYQTGQKYQYQFQQQPAQVFKHFYVHAAPEEPEQAKPRNPVLLPPPQKHYKIIFIKTPSQSAGAAQIVPVQQQNEEKTIVYVLVKKPEDYQDIVVPKVEQKPPSKPEVYFIKYKNKEESQAVINNIVNDYNKGQNSVSFSGAGADALQSGTSTFTGQINSGTVGLSSGGSFGQAEVSSGGSSIGSFASQGDVNSGSSGSSYKEQTHVSSGQTFGQGTENQIAFGFGSESSGALSVATADASAAGATVSSGFDALGASSTATYDNQNTISTIQGVPHETYGIPKFKSQ